MKDPGLITNEEPKDESPLEPNKEKAEAEDLSDEPLFKSLPLEELQKDKSTK